MVDGGPGCCGGTEGHLTGAGVKQEEVWERVPLGSSSWAEAGQAGVSGGRERGGGADPPPSAALKDEGLPVSQARPQLWFNFAGADVGVGELMRRGVGRG